MLAGLGLALVICLCVAWCARRWWLLVLARWEEFEEQHEDSSMSPSAQQQRLSADGCSDEAVNSDVSVVKPRPPLLLCEPGPGAVVQRRPALQRASTSTHTDTRHAADTVGHCAANSQTVASRHVEPVGRHVGGAGRHQWLTQIRNRAHVAISSVLGGGRPVRRYDDTRPPGLRNPSGENVCFLNSVLQALAHTPGLSPCISQLHRRRPNDLLVRHLHELVAQLTTPALSSAPLVLDTSEFRAQVAAEFVGGMIQRPSTTAQCQQDVAECLTWIIDWLNARMSVAADTMPASAPGRIGRVL